MLPTTRPSSIVLPCAGLMKAASDQMAIWSRLGQGKPQMLVASFTATQTEMSLNPTAHLSRRVSMRILSFHKVKGALICREWQQPLTQLAGAMPMLVAVGFNPRAWKPTLSTGWECGRTGTMFWRFDAQNFLMIVVFSRSTSSTISS
jgi:hypothetical protein